MSEPNLNNSNTPPAATPPNDPGPVLTGGAATPTEGATPPAAGAEPPKEGEGGTPPKEGEKPVVPEAYEFKVVEGITLDESLVAEFTPLFKEAGLNQEQAQKMVDLYTKNVVQKQMDAARETVNGWTEASKADKEFGGEKFTESVAIAQRAINTFATPELKQLLTDTGIGSHPEMVRLMIRIGKSMREDGIVNAGSGQGSEKKDSDVFYGK